MADCHVGGRVASDPRRRLLALVAVVLLPTLGASCSVASPLPPSSSQSSVARLASVPAPLPPRNLPHEAPGSALPHEPPASPLVDASPSEDAAPTLAIEALPVPGHLDAVVVVPRLQGELSSRLRLLVVTHGAGGDPEASCRSWAPRSRARALILCPRGRARSRLAPLGYYYSDHLALEAEVQASIDAVRTRFAERLADGGAIYAGYSQGATMGALFLPAHAADFPVLVLTEGGFEWTLNGARKFGRAGGSRVVFVCGTEHCANHARMSVAFLTQVGVLSDLRLALGAGHTETGAIGVRLDALADSFLE